MAENENAVDRIIGKTPWWGISGFFHLSLLLAAALLFGVTAMADEEEPVVIRPPRKLKPIPVMVPERVPDLVKEVLERPEECDIPVFRKVEVTDRNETEDDEEFKKNKGDSLDFVTDKPFKDRVLFDVLGPGGPPGGKIGCPPGSRADLVQIGGGEGTRSAVLAALRWLARHQRRDGSWGASGSARKCNKVDRFSNGAGCSDHKGNSIYDPGVTGLAILAFLGAGYSHRSKDTHDGISFGEVVHKGIRWLISQQDYEGAVVRDRRGPWMYNHLICALALTEAYGRTGELMLLNAAQRAVDFTIQAQNPGMGWRYSYRPDDNDSSVTGWGAMVLKSADLSELHFPREEAYGGVMAWFDLVTEKSYYRVGYGFRKKGKRFKVASLIPSRNLSMTAVACMSRMFLENNRRSPEVVGGCQLLLRDLPEWRLGKIDFYYWYYGSLALFQFGGTPWEKWNVAMKDALVPHQNGETTGCRRGSWEPIDRWSPFGGRVYATAINALTLEVYYRYANVFTGLAKK